MAFTANVYGNALGHAFNKLIDWDTDVIKLALCTSLYVPNQDTNSFFSNVTNELATGGGYTAGGFTLASKTATYDAASNTLVLDAADLSVANTTLTWRVAVIYDATPATAITQPLIGYFVSDVDITSTGGTTSIAFSTSGVVRISAS